MDRIVKIIAQLIKSEVLQTALDFDCVKDLTHEDLSIIYRIAKAHDVTHIVASALFNNKLLNQDEELGQKYNIELLKALSRDERMTFELEQACNILEEAKIPFLPLKGAVIRELYPKTWLRTSCDIDIYVEEANVDLAIDYFCKNYGYKYLYLSDYDKVVISPSGFHIEIHYVLRGIDNAEIRMLKDVPPLCSLVKGWRYRMQMELESLYAYCIAHAHKHFMLSGCGIRSFVDIMLFEARFNINKDKLGDILQDKNLYNFYQGCKQLVNVWFYNGEHNELTRKMGGFVINSGVYGDEKNAILLKYSRLNGNKIKQLFKRFWIDYSSLSWLYPILRKHKWLTPFFQVIRWFKIFKPKKFKKALDETKVLKELTKEDGAEIQSMLNQLK